MVQGGDWNLLACPGPLTEELASLVVEKALMGGQGRLKHVHRKSISPG